MKTKELLETILKVIPASDSKSVLAQTDHLIFGDGLLSAYNGKIAISTPIDLDIECSVPAEDLLKVIKSVDSEEVELNVEEKILHIVSDDMRATLSTEVEEEAAMQAIRNFDLIELLDGNGDLVPKNFIDGLNLCVCSASKNADDVKNLNCIRTYSDQMVSGDGYRATTFSLSSEMEDILIPLSSAVQLLKFYPEEYLTTNGWMHLIDGFDSIFSLRVVEGDFPEMGEIINNFTGEISIELPETIKDVAASLGSIAESPVENFKILEIEITGEEIKCHVEKNGVYATKTVVFEDNDADASFLISSIMLVAILETTGNMELNENFAMFSGESFKHIICLVKAGE